jgi:hypothetical protein
MLRHSRHVFGEDTGRVESKDARRFVPVWHRSKETSKRLDAIPGVGPAWLRLWSRALLIPGDSDRVATSRPGSANKRTR